MAGRPAGGGENSAVLCTGAAGRVGRWVGGGMILQSHVHLGCVLRVTQPQFLKMLRPPGQIRTDTEPILSRLPLPLGYRGLRP